MVDPLVCPRGHHAVRIGTTRIDCETCRNQGHRVTSWDKTELIDHREEEPPLADADHVVATDGGQPGDDAVQQLDHHVYPKITRIAAIGDREAVADWLRETAAEVDPETETTAAEVAFVDSGPAAEQGGAE